MSSSYSTYRTAAESTGSLISKCKRPRHYMFEHPSNVFPMFFWEIHIPNHRTKHLFFITCSPKTAIPDYDPEDAITSWSRHAIIDQHPYSHTPWIKLPVDNFSSHNSARTTITPAITKFWSHLRCNHRYFVSEETHNTDVKYPRLPSPYLPPCIFCNPPYGSNDKCPSLPPQTSLLFPNPTLTP